MLSRGTDTQSISVWMLQVWFHYAFRPPCALCRSVWVWSILQALKFAFFIEVFSDLKGWFL